MRIDPHVVQRWQEMRDMLSAQLAMFESGNLTLKTGGVDVSAHAVRDLRRSISKYDALILDDAAMGGARRRPTE